MALARHHRLLSNRLLAGLGLVNPGGLPLVSALHTPRQKSGAISMHCDSWWDVPVANLLGLCKAFALPAEGSGAVGGGCSLPHTPLAPPPMHKLSLSHRTASSLQLHVWGLGLESRRRKQTQGSSAIGS
jgi:hypothetical protein